MYQVKPKGVNLRDNDRTVPDGFLQESINLQWRDGAYRPIPDRITYFFTSEPTSIMQNANEIILHKVSDEDKINVLVFTGASASAQNSLYWIGTIENGVYTALVSAEGINIGSPSITDLSFTILNGLIYLMDPTEEYYIRLQFNETDQVYEQKDMYAWKDLIPFYPSSLNYVIATDDKGYSNFLLSQCGVILHRFTLVLKTGEEVLPSPIYASYLYALNTDTSGIKKDDSLQNIHTIINTNLSFLDSAVFEDEISAVNIYATIPYYKTQVKEDTSLTAEYQALFEDDDAKGEVQRLADETFYLIKTLDRPSTSEIKDVVFLYVEGFDTRFEYIATTSSKINIGSIASGQIMPVDNFTYHKLYGKINANNGRLVIDNPKTVLSNGHMRALATEDSTSKIGYEIDTEDGFRRGVAYQIDKCFLYDGTDLTTRYRGILSYPDSRANGIGSDSTTDTNLRLYKARENKSHNIACAYDMFKISTTDPNISLDSNIIQVSIYPSLYFYYQDEYNTVDSPSVIDQSSYTSENRLQFAEAGEFSVWPAVNSYRVGEGKIQFVGDNSIDPSNADYIAPLIIGTSEGVYTVNFDVTGATLVQSITKAANMPALSSEVALVDQNLIYVSDKGLIAINNGQLVNLTRDFFPEQGNGDFPTQDTVYPNYNTLTNDFFGGANPYVLTDIVDYLKGAVFAYDGRRNNLWCSNPTKNFSWVYNFVTRQWDISTFVFDKAIDLFGILTTVDGDIYSRYLVRRSGSNNSTYILSGEDQLPMVAVHMLTRPIKMGMPDKYKKIERLIARGELVREDIDGYFYYGLWGKQDVNKNKVNIPLVAIKDDTAASWPNFIRQDIPVGRQRGKYKTISIMLGGKLDPKSSIDGFEITAIPVDNKIMR